MKNNQLNRLIYFFGLSKLLIHFFTNTNYSFHRDEYLYLDQGNHLGLGFMEIPPLLPILSKVISWLGSSVFVTRLFPALIGMATIILAGMIVKNLGGKKWAIIFACGGLLLSPAMLGSNTLFQPVSFNQFFWFLSAYLLLQAIKTEESRFWYFLGLSIGFGFLMKYSIVFYGVSIVIALLISSHRKVFATKYPYQTLLIAMLIAAPNLFWQNEHNWPVLHHMEELAESQLVHMNWGGFLLEQLQFHFTFSIIWIAGLVGLFSWEKFKPYRFLGIGFLLTILLIGSLSGKAYYTIGAFTILFPFGGIVLEKWISKKVVRVSVFLGMTILTIPILPYVLPIFKIDKMKSYCKLMDEKVGLEGPLIWENNQKYELPQDYADMFGWEELCERVAKIYHSLPDEKKENCMIYGGNYGHAGSMNYYGKKYNLPEIHSFASSYVMWTKEEVDFDSQIMIEDSRQSATSSFFEKRTLMDSIQNPFAREAGYIYFQEIPKVDVKEAWRNIVLDQKGEFNF
ncbi:MAG: glycosyltransferase family 39 protein [Saprospiraceae bacterium]